MHRLSGASMIQWGNITPARESSTYTLRSHACAQTPAPAPTPVHKNAERLQRPGLQLGPGRPSRPPQLRHRQTDPTRRANSRVTDWTYETSKWPRECASATHLNGRCKRIRVRTCARVNKHWLPQTQTAGCALHFAAPPPPSRCAPVQNDVMEGSGEAGAKGEQSCVARTRSFSMSVTMLEQARPFSASSVLVFSTSFGSCFFISRRARPTWDRCLRLTFSFCNGRGRLRRRNRGQRLDTNPPQTNGRRIHITLHRTAAVIIESPCQLQIHSTFALQSRAC